MRNDDPNNDVLVGNTCPSRETLFEWAGRVCNDNADTATLRRNIRFFEQFIAKDSADALRHAGAERLQHAHYRLRVRLAPRLVR